MTADVGFGCVDASALLTHDSVIRALKGTQSSHFEGNADLDRFVPALFSDPTEHRL